MVRKMAEIESIQTKEISNSKEGELKEGQDLEVENATNRESDDPI